MIISVCFHHTFLNYLYNRFEYLFNLTGLSAVDVCFCNDSDALFCSLFLLIFSFVNNSFFKSLSLLVDGKFEEDDDAPNTFVIKLILLFLELIIIYITIYFYFFKTFKYIINYLKKYY
jgi:hypothetical protein